MSTTLSKWMTLFLTVTIMFTPILGYLDGLHREAVDMSLHQAMKEASIKGEFSADTISIIEDTLITKYNFDPKSILEIKGTSGTVPRGSFIDAEITVKRTPIFVINIFNQGKNTYTKEASIMSEYIQ